MASGWFPFLLPHVCLRKHASQGVKCRSHLRGKRGQVNGLKSETQEGVLFPRGAPQTGCTHLRIKIPHGIVPIIVSRKSLGWFLFSLGFKAAPGSADDAQNTKDVLDIGCRRHILPRILRPPLWMSNTVWTATWNFTFFIVNPLLSRYERLFCCNKNRI